LFVDLATCILKGRAPSALTRTRLSRPAGLRTQTTTLDAMGRNRQSEVCTTRNPFLYTDIKLSVDLSGLFR